MVASTDYSFYLESFESQEPILILQRDGAVNSKGKLQLTKVDEKGVGVRRSLGRALHKTPVHIWEKKHVASFFTCFSFTINAQDEKNTGDGLAFFLAPVDDQPKEEGSYLGIFQYNQDNHQRYNVLAVEFNTFSDKGDIGDPDSLHISVNNGTTHSRDTENWVFENNTEAVVYISYDSHKNTLKATLVYPNTNKHYTVSSERLNLKDSVEEWVSVGFSAYAGAPETHDVNSWYFASSLGEDTATLAKRLPVFNPDLAKHLNLHTGEQPITK
ncbi:hypothetical protein PIB30_066583 [Stylosanthes scabra]|uniref:Legume lectin domain-containing protein n=1 Tax=Stylosanthes scabra TaxID=79078 RepID=A0ABU6VQN0_9FABA|nr:hypothetical protein [Stylosanthes scabra]